MKLLTKNALTYLFYLFVGTFLVNFDAKAQTTTTTPSTQIPTFKDNEIKFGLNESGSNYIKMTFLNQAWVRYTENNPGTAIFGNPQDNTFDVGLRRTRIQFLGQMTDRVFFYAQFGQNNFTFSSARKVNIFLHDATCEYAFIKKHLSIGAGLMGWNALARFSSPSVGSTMGLDAPLFEQITNDISDQFVRQLGIFAKGKIGKLDYRVSIAQPFTTQTANSTPPPLLNRLPNGENAATYTLKVPEISYRGYFNYQFFDQEANTTPYMNGTYLGTKKVFNIGVGFAYQPNAMWYLGANNKDTIQTAMQHLVVDLFYDAPVNKATVSALTIYAMFMNSDFGKNYIRNLGVMNPANTTNNLVAGKSTFTGAGNAFAMNGTGNTVYVQSGYKFKNDLLKSQGTLMPYAGVQLSNYQAFTETMMMWHCGINWLIKGHNAKISLDYQNRPVFNANTNRDLVQTDRKGMLVLQYQLLF
jgi:hypothetical protein